ncbi:MAG: hypothetical protein V3575_04365, partial [Candidatus Absconditabacteria bacterium]
NENCNSVNTVGNENFRSLHNNGSQPNNNNNNNNNPNHKTNLSNIIKGFKIGCTKEIKYNHNDNGFGWQKSFYDVIIRNDEQLEIIRQYIIDNPMKGE